LLNPGGLPKHLRPEPKDRKDAKGAKLVAIENSNGKRRWISSIDEIKWKKRKIDGEM
jgi:hypothetical protein